MSKNFVNFKNFVLFGLVFTLLFSSIPSSYAENSITIDFYYLDSCSHCHNVLDSNILETIAEKYNATLNKIDAQESSSEFLEIIKYYSDKNPSIQYGGVPFLVVYHNDELKGISLQGDVPIINKLESSVVKLINTNESNIIDIQTQDKDQLKKVSFVYLIITALADSINPCIMSILALLLFQLTMLKDRKKLKKLSYVYIFVVFLSYFIIGLLIYKGVDVISQSLAINNLSFYINAFVVLLLTFGAIVNIKDAFFYGQGISFSLPSFVKPTVEKLTHKLSLFAIITLAVIVTVVEFPCSGLMYLGLISLFINAKLSLLTIIFYLIIYNLIFVLPLIIMVFAVLYFNESVEQVDAYRIKYRKLFRLIMGIVMLLLALYLLKAFVLPTLNITF